MEAADIVFCYLKFGRDKDIFDYVKYGRKDNRIQEVEGNNFVDQVEFDRILIDMKRAMSESSL